MIRTVILENFKSIDRLELALGRVNVFIGENGCGKSNILEAIGFTAAAAADKLDHEFLISRGIRVTEPTLMRSAFKEESQSEPIRLHAKGDGCEFWAILENPPTVYASWKNAVMESLVSEPVIHTLVAIARQSLAQAQEAGEKLTSEALTTILDELLLKARRDALSRTTGSLPSFLTYTPQLEILRELELKTSIEPIGIHGEGLFKLLQVLEQEGHLPEVKSELEMIDWFADLEVFSGPNPAVRALRIRDQYLDSAVAHFDQRSANEGFLFLLLYTCLLVSKYTPTFFAVDNIETGLNPKLCAGLITMFARLTGTHDKQVLLTTHNPGTLDGLDLNDDEQRLFVVYRNIDGATRVRRIERKDLPAGDSPVRLSEAFLRGYIGGLPANF